MKELPQVNVKESSISESETRNELWICYLEIIPTKTATSRFSIFSDFCESELSFKIWGRLLVNH